ncbi:TPT-domain-containing protein [Metschnikowia bicuspidata var. bicuspidata NRRL YB-4993]|uniref:TPT-domain-containing protein n=1 Tax=Metschnikowia bicuspidata var. bicuspidata NRRL YB-4993 TaxID=869754 RepID=A0A1A0HIU0_9ASCO|nr:TPT-domain-containing protein [Metschnikowia bicuspidata var. bicuspidata NRRL YB-4993]OBA23802.1 TPT-domain-containing protein [Metschnikowia bicuspidata var. bicuspidata NRRL YB-4993]
MLSVNPSVEDIHKYVSRQQRTSQINPNHSSTNIFQINHPRALRAPHAGHFVPITPPLSNSPTPITDKRDYFSVPRGLHPSWYRKWAPDINWEVVVLCGFWYAFSIVSSNSTKAILSRFLYPVTLTQFQFVLNALLCAVLFAWLAAAPKFARLFPLGSVPRLDELDHSLIKFLTPTASIISTTLPMGIFQFVGHITSHKATSVIPVSLVHTVKALSPITTILIYKVVYKVKFKNVTYVTLIPLMLGIMLTCYKPRTALVSVDDGYLGGLMYAFVSMFIFVSQNIFAKKRLTYTAPEEPKSESLPVFEKGEEKKLDKLTILLFCSLTGFLFTMPVYLISELQNEVFSLTQVSSSLMCLVVLNGFSHFMQSLLAFLLLGTISTVNYSIANIMKRIMVIIFAFIWEASFSFTGTQSYGIVLTAFGLYAYDKWGIERKKTRPV